jgi:peptidoglycan/xylan/chitin deacetylase (PgdA/CDA1 family)
MGSRYMDRLVLKLLLYFLFLTTISIQSFANNSAVILQYHHVSDSTPRSTSITPKQLIEHLNWINENNFKVLPLTKIVNTLQDKKELSHDKVLAITFDDANHSVCKIAWPILKEYNIPFTLFINSEAVESGYQSQCSWAEIKEMYQSGLMTPANHSHQHLNMVSSTLISNIEEWQLLVKDEVLKAQSLIEANVGYASTLFAYPYGEYNTALTSIITKLGFIGFGQQSGAIGFESDFSALPRYPASGQFANLNTLSVKLNSLFFPAKFSPSSENPILFSDQDNPPKIIMTSKIDSLLKTTNCFNSSGQALKLVQEQDSLIISAQQKLEPGRHRYTCTSQSNSPGRFYWFSHQWLIEEASENTESFSFGKLFKDYF